MVVSNTLYYPPERWVSADIGRQSRFMNHCPLCTVLMLFVRLMASMLWCTESDYCNVVLTCFATYCLILIFCVTHRYLIKESQIF